MHNRLFIHQAVLGQPLNRERQSRNQINQINKFVHGIPQEVGGNNMNKWKEQKGVARENRIEFMIFTKSKNPIPNNSKHLGVFSFKKIPFPFGSTKSRGNEYKYLSAEHNCHVLLNEL